MLEVYKTNMLGPLLTTQAFLPLLQKGSKKQVLLGTRAVLELHHALLQRRAC